MVLELVLVFYLHSKQLRLRRGVEVLTEIIGE